MYSLKLELKLNTKERSKLAGCAGFLRLVYNYGLEMLKSSWGWDIKATDSQRLSLIEKIFTNSVKNKSEFSWMKDYPSAIYSQTFRHLAKALGRWRKGKSGFPQPKSKKDGDSFTVLKKSGIYDKPVKDGGKLIPFTNRQVLQPGKKITIPGLGEFRLKRPIFFLCSSQTFTISRTADKWFVSFSLDVDKVPPLFHEEELVGIDLGVKCFATLSNGTEIQAPSSIKTAKTKLSKEQWRHRQKQFGNRQKQVRISNNAKKYLAKLAKSHAHIANIRYDFLQKTTTEISKKYYRIRIEDLNVSGMIANRKLSEAISSIGFYEFRRQLIYKSEFFGTKVELVDRWFPSSKTCSCCGHIQSMPLSERVFDCQNCEHTQDRDWNAAINLTKASESKVRLASPELNACGEEGVVSPRRNKKQNYTKQRVS